jgi:hypothetical protein
MRHLKLLLLVAALFSFTAQPALAQPADPLAVARTINSPEFRPHRERAVQLMDALWEPGEPVPDKWYRDIRTETLALLLYYRWIGEPGASGPAPPPDARCSAIDARWPGLLDVLEKAGKR